MSAARSTDYSESLQHQLSFSLAGNLASKKELLTGRRVGISLKTKDSLLSRSSLLMCQMSGHMQYRNHHQFRKKKLPQFRVQLRLHLKLMLSQKSLKVRMPRLLKVEQHMIKMRTSQQKVLRTVHLPAVPLEAHLGNFQILNMERQHSQSDDHAGVGSMFYGDKGSDEPAWWTFDTNDDVDSVWGFNAVCITKDMDQQSNKDHYFSGPGEFGLYPIRTGSSQGGGFSQKSRPFAFDDSVPSTPLSAFSSGYSPPRYKDNSEPSFDTFSRFDSFRSTQDIGFFRQPETLKI